MIYLFACDNCKTEFEVNVPMSENKRPLGEPCPSCGVSGQVFRVFQSGTNFHSGSVHDQAGRGWKDILGGIRKASSSDNIIDV